MTFKPGDMVIVIYLAGAYYPDDCQPGVIGTVRGRCTCVFACDASAFGHAYYSVDLPTGTFCVNARILRKLDDDGRTVVSWDDCVWRPAREAA